jgi:hypothetical protein
MAAPSHPHGRCGPGKGSVVIIVIVVVVIIIVVAARAAAAPPIIVVIILVVPFGAPAWGAAAILAT